MDTKLIAKAVLFAQDVYESSYDRKTRKYKLGHPKCAKVACIKLGIPLNMVYPIYLLNLLAWNDIQDWAEKHDA